MESLAIGKLKQAIIILGITIISVLGIQINDIEAKASGQDNIVQRADYAYNLTWTALKTVRGWQGNKKYTFYQGEEHHIPYGQPYNSSGYFYYNVSIDDYVAATKDVNSVFYTKSSSGLAPSTYYSTDCSGFVSYCWDLPTRHTTSTMVMSAKSYGLCNSYNVGNLQIGDALNRAGSHVVLVTDIINDNGALSYEITEQTPPELKRTVLTQSSLISKYKTYTILRCNTIDSVQAIPVFNEVVADGQDQGELEPAPFPGTETEGNLEPAPFPGTDEQGELEPAPFPGTETTSELEAPSLETETTTTGELEPAPFPGTETTSDLKPAPFPGTDTGLEAPSLEDVTNYQSDLVSLPIPLDILLVLKVNGVDITEFANYYSEDNLSPGDIDCDGVITKNDALVVYDYYHGISDLMPDQFLRSDLNGDGVLNDYDVLNIIKLAYMQY